MTFPRPRHLLLSSMVLFGLAGILAGGCASTGPYVSSNVSNPVTTHASECQQFEYVRVEQKGEQLTLYGKLDSNDHACQRRGHVQVTVSDAEGNALERFCLSIVDRGQRRRGWFGAAFRTRIPYTLPPGAAVELSICDDVCRDPDQPFDCEVSLLAD